MNDVKLTDQFLKELEAVAYDRGYNQAMKDALVTIINLLKHNDIRMKPREFWAEYKNLKDEGVIK